MRTGHGPFVRIAAIATASMVIVAPPLWASAAGASSELAVGAPAAIWAFHATPPGGLEQVSCGGDGFCVATTAGPGAFVYVTTNFGGSWSKRDLPAGPVETDDVACGGPSNCVVVGDDNQTSTYVSYTANRGQSWSASQTSFFGAYVSIGLACGGASRCIEAGYSAGELPSPISVVSTQDGGKDWQSVSLPAGANDTGQAEFGCASNATCIMANGGEDESGSGFPPNSIQMYETSDGGSTWSKPSNSLGNLAYANGIACAGPPNCIVVGSTAATSAGAGQAWFTSGDQVWERARVPSSVNSLASVACTNTVDCWSTGTAIVSGGKQAGVILDSTDAGRTWSVEVTASTDFDSIACASGSCIAVGPSEVAQLLAPIATIAATPDGKGYDLASIDGEVFSYGDAAFAGDLTTTHLYTPVVSIARTSDGGGYWLATAGGGVYPFGDAKNYGSEGGHPLTAPIVAMASTSDGRGYYLVSSAGDVYAFGDARFHGSMGGQHLNAPIVGMAVDGATGGYWLVASDGGIFAFDAKFYGSAGSLHLAKPIVGMEALVAGNGYRFVAADGGVFDFGAASFDGSLGGHHLLSPVTGMAAQPGGDGYWLAQSDGSVTAFG
jgi:hypothetical protein